MPECSGSEVGRKLELSRVGRRRFEADFSAGQVSSDGGSALLREADLGLGLSARLASCFTDHRNPALLEHTVAELVAQRVYGLALGYEDLSDHARLSRDPLLAAVVGKSDPEGQERRGRGRGQGMASPSTLGRVERTEADANARSRYAKVVCDFEALREQFVQMFIESQHSSPERLVLDVDPTDIELHGHQEQRFYHGYYGHYCYLPMYLYCGEYPLSVKLRPSNIDGALGVVDLVSPVVTQLREAFPSVHLIIRADSGFCREEWMAWCEQQRGVDYVLGMAKNSRAVKRIEKQLEQARREFLQTGEPARRFRDFRYQTHKTWSRSRRVVGKAEYLTKGANPRFVVTSLAATHYEKRYLYEELYCARGEMENRLKEQLELFADRASCHTFRGNEIRLWWAMAAQLLVVTIRRFGLAGTELEKAQAPRLRHKLFKIGALITVSARRIYARLSSAFPLKELLVQALHRLRQLSQTSRA